MTLKELSYFVHVADAGSMTKTASAFFVSQPSVSKMIRSLEASLDVRLFVRERENISLTAAGEIMYKYAVRILDSILDAELEIQDLKHAATNHIRLSVLSASDFLPQILSKIKVLDPKITFQVSQGNDEDWDILISSCGEPLETADTRVCLKEPIVLVYPESNDEIPPRIRLKDISRYPLIMLEKGKIHRRIIDDYCNKHGIRLITNFESDNPSTIRAMLTTGYGMSLVPEYTWRAHDIENTRISTIDDEDFCRYITVSSKNGRYLTAVQRKVRDYMVEFFQNQSPKT